jgi:hypothetical protein
LFTGLAKGASAGVVTEVPTEIGQQVLERAQAGLPLDNDEAMQEYTDAAVGAGLIGGGIGGVSGGISGRRGAAKPKTEEEEDELTEKPPTPAGFGRDVVEQRLRTAAGEDIPEGQERALAASKKLNNDIAFGTPEKLAESAAYIKGLQDQIEAGQIPEAEIEPLQRTLAEASAILNEIQGVATTVTPKTTTETPSGPTTTDTGKVGEPRVRGRERGVPPAGGESVDAGVTDPATGTAGAGLGVLGESAEQVGSGKDGKPGTLEQTIEATKAAPAAIPENYPLAGLLKGMDPAVFDAFHAGALAGVDSTDIKPTVPAELSAAEKKAYTKGFTGGLNITSSKVPALKGFTTPTTPKAEVTAPPTAAPVTSLPKFADLFGATSGAEKAQAEWIDSKAIENHPVVSDAISAIQEARNAIQEGTGLKHTELNSGNAPSYEWLGVKGEQSGIGGSLARLANIANAYEKNYKGKKARTAQDVEAAFNDVANDVKLLREKIQKVAPAKAAPKTEAKAAPKTEAEAQADAEQAISDYAEQQNKPEIEADFQKAQQAVEQPLKETAPEATPAASTHRPRPHHPAPPQQRQLRPRPRPHHPAPPQQRQLRPRPRPHHPAPPQQRQP